MLSHGSAAGHVSAPAPRDRTSGCREPRRGTAVHERCQRARGVLLLPQHLVPVVMLRLQHDFELQERCVSTACPAVRDTTRRGVEGRSFRSLGVARRWGMLWGWTMTLFPVSQATRSTLRTPAGLRFAQRRALAMCHGARVDTRGSHDPAVWQRVASTVPQVYDGGPPWMSGVRPRPTTYIEIAVRRARGDTLPGATRHWCGSQVCPHLSCTYRSDWSWCGVYDNEHIRCCQTVRNGCRAGRLSVAVAALTRSCCGTGGHRCVHFVQSRLLQVRQQLPM